MKSSKDLLAITQKMLSEPKEGKVEEEAAIPGPSIADVKNVPLDKSFINECLSVVHEAKGIEKAKPKEEPKVELTEAEKLEERLTSLVERLSSLLKEARTVMSEMTSTGCIGVGTQTNLLAPKKKKKKRKTNELS